MPERDSTVAPSLFDWVADGPGGLARGFVVSALVLGVGALLATRQRPLVVALANPS